MNYDLLFSSQPNKIELAIIGVSGFNHSLFKYGVRNDKLSIRVLCGRNIQKCIDAYKSVGIEENDILYCTDFKTGIKAFKAGKSLIFDDISLAMQMPIDIVVEGTGSPEASARYILAAIENGKNIIVVTKESDSVVGSIIAKKAKEKGVLYSLADGDQPSLLIGLITWVKNAGLKILSAGKASEYDFIYNPKEATIQVQEQKIAIKDFEKLWDLGADPIQTIQHRSEILKEFNQRALPDLVEMAIVCNHLADFDPDSPTFHFPIARAIEIPDLMCPKDMGGLFNGEKRIDVVNCLRRIDEQSLEGGEFVVVACDDEDTWKVLKEKGVPLSRNEKTAMIYYPAHYLGLEAIFSVLSVGILGLPTSSINPTPRYDVVARAVKSIPKGTVLRARGHHHIIDGLEGIVLPAKRIDENVQLPYYLADGMILKRNIEAGELITAGMLDPTDYSLLWSLRKEQDETFLT